ncbi:hypothetical protein C5167_009977 [Papaver somniferum]|uniref:Uncharacterized protein n=1 Tax=Papaver somniferum TaxID=3469 RepID=A0A4Y7K1Z1_PAPSO|nr:hypothetical protein C5167_009977 [Papaver somniferum]
MSPPCKGMKEHDDLSHRKVYVAQKGLVKYLQWLQKWGRRKRNGYEFIEIQLVWSLLPAFSVVCFDQLIVILPQFFETHQFRLTDDGFSFSCFDEVDSGAIVPSEIVHSIDIHPSRKQR